MSVRVSGKYGVPDGRLSHRLTLVMKSSEKRGSEGAGTSTSSKAPIPFYPVPDYYKMGSYMFTSSRKTETGPLRTVSD